MHNGVAPTTLRRSSRVPTAVQILVTSLEGTHFSEVCETLVVNAHGCAILTRVKLDTGVPLNLHSKDGRETTAHVVSCRPVDSDHRSWRLGAKLDRPDNFWGLRDCPKDWIVPAPAKPPQILKPANTSASHQLSSQENQPSEAVLDRFARQLEAQVKRTIAESLRPLQAEVMALKDRVAQRDANPSRFEVSLSNIPPELEQQIESRLRKDLEPKVLDEARQQSVQLLESAKATLDQRTTQSYDSFMRRVAEELTVVEKRAQDISAHISENTREYLQRGLEDYRQRLLQGGDSLKRLSEELLEFLQHNLNAEHEARRGDLEQLRASVASESSRLQEQVEYLDTRIAKLDESTRCMESGLDHRLSRMSSEIVKDTRNQYQSLANEILEELTARSIKALSDQLDEATENMKVVQNGIVASAAESLKSQAANALQAFENSTGHLARLSLERWRLKLEGGLNALAKSLNE
jgi:hypothetical protein